MTSKEFLKINTLIHCRLTLEDGTEFTIPMREDGYIYATKLCNVGGKLMGHWLELKETKELIQKIQYKLDGQMSISESRDRNQNDKNNTSISEITDHKASDIELISKNTGHKQAVEVHRGGNRYQQGTWIHPDLGIHLAQWISPEFSLQVSKWVRELLVSDEVRLGSEKSEKEISERYEAIIAELQNKIDRSENTIISITNECRYLLSKYKVIQNTHRSYLRRKELYRLKEGPCVYLINMSENESKIKIGYTGDITNRVSGYRTSSPFCRLLYLVYTHENVLVEKCMKTRYHKNLLPNNSEFITDVSAEDIRQALIDMMNSLSIEYTEQTEEELRRFNQHNVAAEEVEQLDIEPENWDEDSLKRCGGFGHKDEASRMLPRREFFRNRSNRDGYARICKNCYLTIQYGDERKKKKIVQIPPFDTTTHKWCNRCETVRSHDEFYNDKMTKDGLGANCKICKAHQKRDYLAKKKTVVATEATDANQSL